MTRIVAISDADLRRLVDQAAEPIRIRGTHADHRALSQAQMALDTMLPDAERLLEWANGTRAIRAIATADQALRPDASDAVTFVQSQLRHQLDKLGLDPFHALTGLGALGALLTASSYASALYDAGDIDPSSYRQTARVLSAASMAVCRFAPAEVRP